MTSPREKNADLAAPRDGRDGIALILWDRPMRIRAADLKRERACFMKSQLSLPILCDLSQADAKSRRHLPRSIFENKDRHRDEDQLKAATLFSTRQAE